MGVATYGGSATLVATLTSSATGQRVEGATVNFTLNGKPVGSAVTDADGQATLTEVATSDPAGIHAGAVAANFAGDSSYTAASTSGSLQVYTSSTSLSAVSGTAGLGGPATLTATLTSLTTEAGVAGATVTLHPRRDFRGIGGDRW